jgi:1-deoxyxylulose-5-phosphate synthase
MKTKRMGRTGLKVSEICLGTMTFGKQCDEATSFAIMDTTVEFGVDYFDTANAYPAIGEMDKFGRTEEIIGRWLQQRGKRDQIVLATKCWGPMSENPNDRGLSRKAILSAVEGSLRRLQRDYIDIYYAHMPDPETPVDETLQAFDDLVRQGKVRYLACSNFQAWLLATALWTSDKLGLARFDCIQPRYNLLFREPENELLPLCRHHGLGVMPYNPLAGGFLTGKYQPVETPAADTRFGLSFASPIWGVYRKRYWQDAQFAAVEALQQFFTPRHKPLTQVAIAWVLAQPGVTSPILGTTSAEQLRQALPAIDLTLDTEEMEACNEAWFNLPRVRDPSIALR